MPTTEYQRMIEAAKILSWSLMSIGRLMAAYPGVLSMRRALQVLIHDADQLENACGWEASSLISVSKEHYSEGLKLWRSPPKRKGKPKPVSFARLAKIMAAAPR